MHSLGAFTREFIAEHHAEQQAERQRTQQWQAEQAANDPMNQVREQVRALGDRQRQLRAAGILDPDLPAAAVMQATDYQRRVDAKSRHLDEMMASGKDGTLTMHAIDTSGEA